MFIMHILRIVLLQVLTCNSMHLDVVNDVMEPLEQAEDGQNVNEDHIRECGKDLKSRITKGKPEVLGLLAVHKCVEREDKPGYVENILDRVLKLMNV